MVIVSFCYKNKMLDREYIENVGWSEEAQFAMIKNNIKMRDLVRRTGYSRQHIYRIIHEKYNPMPKEAQTTISHILGISLPEV